MERTLARRATFLIMLTFLLQPMVIGGWLALIPLVKASIGLSKGELALALLGAPVALIPSLQVAGRMVSRFGPRRIFMVFFPVQSAAVLLVLAAWSGPSLFAALFLTGIGIGFLEVGINVYAGRLEKRAGLTIMLRCHGFWALGLTIGSAVMTLMIAQPFAGLALLSFLSVTLALPAARAMPQLGEEAMVAAPPRRKLRDLPAALIAIAVFMFLVTLGEGAMADWAAVYLSERLGNPEARAGIAVTLFSACLAGGRFAGDWLKIRLGA
ncbi:MAG: MFS transporter, partial [Silicimonas sp.]|nr:MFS transporter [Silicimonas sp.]